MSIVYIEFFPSDFLAGCRGLDAAETGVYITLLCRMYEMAGPIERDDERLSRLCGVKQVSTFVKILEYLISDGKVTELDGSISNDRVEKEVAKLVEKSEKAKAAAEARWRKKPSKNNGASNATASVEHMPEACQPKPKPKPKEYTGQRFEEFWEKYPHRSGVKKGKALALTEYKKAINGGTPEDTIIKAAEALQRDKKAAAGFALDPKNWLKGCGWEDELDLGGTISSAPKEQTEDDLKARLKFLERMAGQMHKSGGGWAWGSRFISDHDIADMRKHKIGLDKIG